jgi:hypothetical protein
MNQKVLRVDGTNPLAARVGPVPEGLLKVVIMMHGMDATVIVFN